MDWATSWANFFTNSSGHPEPEPEEKQVTDDEAEKSKTR
jgi:hypothetical protein